MTNIRKKSLKMLQMSDICHIFVPRKGKNNDYQQRHTGSNQND